MTGVYIAAAVIAAGAIADRIRLIRCARPGRHRRADDARARRRDRGRAASTPLHHVDPWDIRPTVRIAR